MGKISDRKYLARLEEKPFQPSVKKQRGCGVDRAVTSVTPLISRVDVADLAGWMGVPFLPHRSMRSPPKAAHRVKQDDLPLNRGEPVFGQGSEWLCFLAGTSKQAHKSSFKERVKTKNI